jgi:drug/metabolite transporter (DMT)-like permease
MVESTAPNYKGIAKGLTAVVIFSLTVPMTKIALTGFSPEAIAAVRVLLAGIFSLFLIGKLSSRIPTLRETGGLLVAGLGVCVGFPYGISLALEQTTAVEMGIALSALPLLTAILAIFVSKERHNVGFWIAAFAGFALLSHYFSNGLSVDLPASLLLTLASAAFGYAIGGHVAKTLGGWQTICWMMILYLPVSGLTFGYYALDGFNWNLEAGLALIYLALFSQWLGFHFWYDGMAQAGIGRISQLQLLQPFFTLIFAALLLNEALQLEQLGYVLLIAVAVFSALKFR